MKIFWSSVREIIFTGLLHGWPGRRCPECDAHPGDLHRTNCAGRKLGEYWA